MTFSQSSTWWENIPSRLIPEVHRLQQRIERRQSRSQPVDRLQASLNSLLQQGQEELAQRQQAEWTLEYPESLPVSAAKDEVLTALAGSSFLVLTGETGSGKTTQLPKMLLEAGCGKRGRLAVTQPRRLAALAVAARLREECEVRDSSITHAVRFDDQSDADSRVVVMTDGLLLAEASRDPLLSRYDAVMVDEAHERSTNIDVLLALLIRIRTKRPDLVVVITSATIDGQRMSDYLGQHTQSSSAPLIEVPGRLFPVERRQFIPERNDQGYLGNMVDAVQMVHEESTTTGDVLCFLPTERDILEAHRRLQELPGATVLPCFGRLTAAEQQRIFQPCSGRKVVLATPIAETSLTIPGISTVIDSGLARLKRYQAQARTERLPIEPVSQASLKQRAGRAGRLGPGVCYQLFDAQDAESRAEFTEPEILRSNLSGVLLQLLASGIADPENLPWLDNPRPGDWQQAWRMLNELGAVTEQGRLTSLGRKLSHLPLDPQLARMCLAGFEEGVAHDAITVAAFLSIQDPRLRPLGEEAKADSAQRVFHHEAGDIMSVISCWDAFQTCTSSSARSRFIKTHYLSWLRMREWADVRRQIVQTLKNYGTAKIPTPPPISNRSTGQIDSLHKSVLSGMLGMVLMRDDQERCYRGAGNRSLHIHPSSVMNQQREKGKSSKRIPWPEFLLSCEIIETSRTFARMCAPIDPQWILALAGKSVKRRLSEPLWNRERGRLVVREDITWLGLPIVSGKEIPAEQHIPREEAERLFMVYALARFDFQRIPRELQANRRIIDNCSSIAERMRDRSLALTEEHIATAYQKSLNAINRGDDPRPLTSVAALQKLFRDFGKNCLRLRETDLSSQWRWAERSFPREIVAGPGLRLAVTYRYNPGEDHDGASVFLTERDLTRFESWRVERAIPGLIQGQVAHWSEKLSKTDRRTLQPLEHRILEWVEALQQSSEPLPQAMHRLWHQALGPDAALPSCKPPPIWTRIRLVIINDEGAELSSARDLSNVGSDQTDDPLQALRARWQTDPAQFWPGDVPEFCGHQSQPAYAALVRCRGKDAEVAVQRTVFASKGAGQAWHLDGVESFLEASLQDDIQRIVADVHTSTVDAPSAIRGALLGLWRTLPLAECRTEQQAGDLIRDARSLVDQKRQVIRDWARTYEGVRKVLSARMRRGGSGLGALAQISQVQRLEQTFLGPQWWLGYPWWALELLPDWLNALIDLLDGTLRMSSRDAARAQRILSDWHDFNSELTLPMARALGQAESWRTVQATAGACWFAIARGQKPRKPASELLLRSSMQELRESYNTACEQWHRSTRKLRDIRPALDRVGGPMAQSLAQEIDQRLRHGLDFGLMADLQNQPLALLQLAERAKRLL